MTERPAKLKNKSVAWEKKIETNVPAALRRTVGDCPGVNEKLSFCKTACSAKRRVLPAFQAGTFCEKEEGRELEKRRHSVLVSCEPFRRTLKHWRRQGIVVQLFNYLPMLNRIKNVQN